MINLNIEQVVMNDILNQAHELMSDWGTSRNRQKQFVIAYIKGNFSNATEAAKKAGYSENNARQQGAKLLTTRHIKNVLADVQDSFEYKSLELSIASSIEIKQYLTAVMRGEQFDQILIHIGNGKQAITEIHVSTSERIKAAELLGKSMKMFTDKIEHELQVPIFIDDLDELED